jgi:hypothetical protein
MRTTFIWILLILLTACQSGLIPCPKVKNDRVKKAPIGKRIRYAERNTTASAREIQQPRPTTAPRNTQTYTRTQIRPALEHVDVEEWDCPKPGSKRSMPKSVKDNIRKNKKAFESYYRSRDAQDSVATNR